MMTPRLEIDLDKIDHNARTLVERLALRGITVTGITKATLGSAEIAGAMLRAGVVGLGDSRIENIEAMRRKRIQASMVLIRSPMISQVDRVVQETDASFNSELATIARLSFAAQAAKRRHGVLLMIELGDLREGIMPDDLEETVREMRRLPNIVLKGVGTNLACRSGVEPDAENMAALSKLASSIEAKFGLELEIVSGGNSANLQWALSGDDTGRINNLRLGESILLGCDPLDRQPITGLHTDAITLVAEVIESKTKPTQPWGKFAQTAFGAQPRSKDRGPIVQTILAIGRQDIDPVGLTPPSDTAILAASSDHLVVETDRVDIISPGSEMTFRLGMLLAHREMSI